MTWFFPKTSDEFFDDFEYAIRYPQHLWNIDYTAIQLLQTCRQKYGNDMDSLFFHGKAYRLLLESLKKSNIQCATFIMAEILTKENQIKALKDFLNYQLDNYKDDCEIVQSFNDEKKQSLDFVNTIRQSRLLQNDTEVFEFLAIAIQSKTPNAKMFYLYDLIKKLYSLHGHSASEESKQHVWNATNTLLKKSHTKGDMDCEDGHKYSSTYIDRIQGVCLAYCLVSTNAKHMLDAFLETPIEKIVFGKNDYIISIAQAVEAYSQDISMSKYFLAIERFFVHGYSKSATYYIGKYIEDSYNDNVMLLDIQRDVYKILTTSFKTYHNPKRHLEDVRKIINALHTIKIDDNVKYDICGYILDSLLSTQKYEASSHLLDYIAIDSAYMKAFGTSHTLQNVLKSLYATEDIQNMIKFARALHSNHNYDLLYNIVINKGLVLRYDKLFEYMINSQEDIRAKTIESVLEYVIKMPRSALHDPNAKYTYGPEDKRMFATKLDKLLKAATLNAVDVSSKVHNILDDMNNWDKMQCMDNEKVLFDCPLLSSVLTSYLDNINLKNHDDAACTETTNITTETHVNDDNNLYSNNIINQASLSEELFSDTKTDVVDTALLSNSHIMEG